MEDGAAARGTMYRAPKWGERWRGKLAATKIRSAGLKPGATRSKTNVRARRAQHAAPLQGEKGKEAALKGHPYVGRKSGPEGPPLHWEKAFTQKYAAAASAVPTIWA